MNISKGENLLKAANWLETDEDCMKYLTEDKWEDGFECSHIKIATSEICFIDQPLFKSIVLNKPSLDK